MEFLSEMGIDNMGIAATEKARIINDNTFETVSEGWQIVLARNDGNSVPIQTNLENTFGLLYGAT